MSAAKNPPAFPRALPKGEFPPEDAARIIEQHSGMTLRDYFAAKAMTAIMADQRFALGYDPAHVADRAYEYADAMLNAREVQS